MLAGLGFAVWFAREYVGGIDYVLTLLAYTSLLYLLLLAKFWWVRDPDGDWTWSAFSTRARVAITDVAQTIFDAQERSWAGVLDELRAFLLALGTGLVVLGAPVAAIVGAALSFLGLEQERANFTEFVNTMSVAGTAMIAVALLTWFLKKAQRRAPQADSFKRAAVALRDIRDLPFVIDTFDPDGNGAPAELQVLLHHIARWKPRHQDSEAAYEASLKRFLQRELPGAKVERQQSLQTSDGRMVGKVDLVVDDVLAIELKRLLRSSEADRAVGQIWKYAEAWTRGPVMLLLCETRAGFAQAGFIDRIGELRDRGRPLFVVAAGRRLG
ncbi:MAG: hypothetical protein ABI548_03445 [Polyangiaceae bacterium]